MRNFRASVRHGVILFGASMVAITFAFAPLPAVPQSAPGDKSKKSEMPALDELLSGIVRIKTHINPEGRTVETLGTERTGSGVVIDGNGLVVTIGYLMVEAHSAELITQDNRTGDAFRQVDAQKADVIILRDQCGPGGAVLIAALVLGCCGAGRGGGCCDDSGECQRDDKAYW